MFSKIPNGDLVNLAYRTSMDIERVKKRFRILHKMGVLRKLSIDWYHNRICITKLGEKLGLNCCLVLRHILQYSGFTKAELQTLFSGLTGDRYIDDQVEMAIIADFSFSHWGQRIQKKLGALREQELETLISTVTKDFETEEALRGMGNKTPDFYFPRGLSLNDGRVLYWIESKALYGTQGTYRGNLTKQLGPYRDLFGEGMVVYWYGRDRNLEAQRGVLVCDVTELTELLL